MIPEALREDRWSNVVKLTDMVFGNQLDMMLGRRLDVAECHEVCILIIIVFDVVLPTLVDSHLPHNVKGIAIARIRVTENAVEYAVRRSVAVTVVVELYSLRLEGSLSTEKPFMIK